MIPRVYACDIEQVIIEKIFSDEILSQLKTMVNFDEFCPADKEMISKILESWDITANINFNTKMISVQCVKKNGLVEKHFNRYEVAVENHKMLQAYDVTDEIDYDKKNIRIRGIKVDRKN